MAGSFTPDEDAPFASINVVPLVDVILVVLIIFMVTAPMIVRPSINVNLPKATSGEQSTETPFNIAISASGQIFLNGKAASENELSEFAKSTAAKSADTQAVIAADKDTPHGKVVGVLDVVKLAGIKRFAISIDKK